MNVRKHIFGSVGLHSQGLSAIMLLLVGCQGSGSNAAANSSSATNANNPELFTIPQDQMSHVQVLTRSAHNADSVSAADGSRRLQQFSDDTGHHAGERTGQPGRGRSRAESKSGRAHVVRGESGLLAAPHQLFKG